MKLLAAILLLSATQAFGAANKITNAELATMANGRFKCRTSSGTGQPEDCTATQATALLDVMVGDSGSGGTAGLCPAPGAGDAAANYFLKADATWAAAGVSDHGALSGLSDDDHSQYLLLAGRGSGGQTVTDPITIDSTTTNQTLLSLNPQSGSNWDWRVEGANFRLDHGASSSLVFSSGYVNIGGTRTPLNQIESQVAVTSTDPSTGLTQNTANLPIFAAVNSSATANNWSAYTFVGGSTASTGIDCAMVGVHEAHTSGAETGHLEFWCRNAGTLGQLAEFGADGTVTFNAYGSGGDAILYATNSTGELAEVTIGSGLTFSSGSLSADTAVVGNLARVANNGSAASITRQSGSWLTSVNRGGAGTVTVTFASSFTNTPACFCTNENSTTRACSTDSVSTSSVIVRTYATNDFATDDPFAITCQEIP